jgi:hypothetical protein
MAASLVREGRADLRRAQSANGAQGERELRLDGELRMKADEEHAQRVIGEEVLVSDSSRVSQRSCSAVICVFFALPGLFTAQSIEREVLRRLREPCGGVFRDAAIRPRLQRPHERLLHDVLSELQMVRAEMRGERGHESRSLAAEEIIRHEAGTALAVSGS